MAAGYIAAWPESSVKGILGVNGYADALSHTGRPRLFRLGRLGLGVVALGVLAGSFGQMTPDEQAAVRQVNTILQNGLATASDAGMPSALRSISNFHARASRHYTPAQRTDVTTDFSVAGSSAVQMIAVDVLFDNGFHFQCRVGQSLAQPFCTED